MGAYLYEYTNESLASIVHGLQPRPGDKVVCILGSGDQAFALLENQCEIVAVDTNPAQLEIGKRRKHLLEKEEFAQFLQTRKQPEENSFRFWPLFPESEDNSYYLRNRERYFTADRLQRIQPHVERLSLREGNITSIATQLQPNSVYLSNILDFSWREEIGTATKTDTATATTQILADLEGLPIGTRIYTCHIGDQAFIPQKHGFELNIQRTAVARRYNALEGSFHGYGEPKVYDKIA